LAQIAEGMAHTGILRPSHFKGSGPDSIKGAVDSALSELTKAHERRWKLHKDLTIGYTTSLAGINTPPAFESEARANDTAAIVFESGQRQVFIIGERLDGIEKRQRGAGVKLLRLIELALDAGFGGITPLTGMSMMQWHFWQGSCDEKERLEDLRLNWEEEREEGAPPMTDAEILKECDIPSRADFESWFPKWTYDIGWPNLNQVVIPFFKSPIRGEPAIRAAANALSRHLSSFWRQRMYATGRDRLNDLRQLEATIEFAAPIVLRWHENDMLPAIFDEVMQDFMNSGDTNDDMCAAVCFDPASPASCRDAGERVRLILETTGLIDQLLSLLVTKEPLSRTLGYEVTTEIPAAINTGGLRV
jgi:PRTRC genetic system protein F